MCKKNDYIVRVTSLADTTGSFVWELCRADHLLQRSTKTFPTRVEALFDSAQNATLLAFGSEERSSAPY